MPKVNWTWFVVGAVFALFVLPLVTSTLARVKKK